MNEIVIDKRAMKNITAGVIAFAGQWIAGSMTGPQAAVSMALLFLSGRFIWELVAMVKRERRKKVRRAKFHTYNLMPTGSRYADKRAI